MYEYDQDIPTFPEFIVIVFVLALCMIGTILARIWFHTCRLGRWFSQ